jgi:hypothetical protein
MKILISTIFFVITLVSAYAETDRIDAKFIQISNSQNLFTINHGISDGIHPDDTAEFYINETLAFHAIVRKSVTYGSAWKITENFYKKTLSINDQISFIKTMSDIDSLKISEEYENPRIPMFSKEVNYSHLKNLFSK